MATTTNKQKLLTQFFALLKKLHDGADQEARPVLEQFIYGLLRQGSTRAQADEAYKNLRQQFFDWNEVRVSSPRELEEVMPDVPDGEQRAERVIALLQEVFETTFSFDLETMHKKGVKQAAKALGRYQAADDYVCSWVVQQSLGGHAIPLDAPSLRVCRRLGLLETDVEDLETLRTSLEHLVPKAKGPLFTNLVSQVAAEFCWEESPRCHSCPLSDECPTGQAQAAEEAAAARSTRSKPR